MTRRAVPATYQVTVAGGIGPVLRHALRPCAASPSSGCTVVRLDDPADLVDLLELLHSAGLEVESIAAFGDDDTRTGSAMGGTSSTPHDASSPGANDRGGWPITSRPGGPT